jgi:hypothetical protein
LRTSLELVTEPETIGTPARASAVRLAMIASSVPYSNRPPSDEAAMMAPRAARPATRRASGAVSFQS